MLNILFHGASVTQQSGVESYFSQLQSLSEGSNFSLHKAGYGGCHFNDAGFLTIKKDILEKKFDIVFLEWNTPGSASFDVEKLEYLISTLVENSILPVFLILARVDNIIDRVLEQQINFFCSENSILKLDLRALINPKIHLRDDVHTNEIGALIYANNIIKYINKIETKKYIFLNNIKYKKNIKYQIQHYKYPIQIEQNQSLKLDLSNICDGAEIIFSLLIGPDSPYILVNKKSQLLLWDRWCHFERKNFRIIWSLGLKNDHLKYVDIEVLDLPVDYSLCERELDFIGLKKMKISDIYSINCSIDKIII